MLADQNVHHTHNCLVYPGGGAIRFSNTGKVSKKSKVAGGEGDIITNTIHV